MKYVFIMILVLIKSIEPRRESKLTIMKLLLLTALALATTGAYAQEYTTVIQGSEQITDVSYE